MKVPTFFIFETAAKFKKEVVGGCLATCTLAQYPATASNVLWRFK
jgi:hypothetical protein